MEHLMRPHSKGVYLPHDSSERPIQTHLEAQKSRQNAARIRLAGRIARANETLKCIFLRIIVVSWRPWPGPPYGETGSDHQ